LRRCLKLQKRGLRSCSQRTRHHTGWPQRTQRGIAATKSCRAVTADQRWHERDTNALALFVKKTHSGALVSQRTLREASGRLTAAWRPRQVTRTRTQTIAGLIEWLVFTSSSPDGSACCARRRQTAPFVIFVLFVAESSLCSSWLLVAVSALQVAQSASWPMLSRSSRH
jgi:hypothetical protein